MDVATGVIVFAVNGAALASFYIYFQKRILDVSERLEQIKDDAWRARYAAPMPSILATVPVDVPADADIVGAWAAEREAMGIHVTDEELSIQRRMWAEEGH